MNLKPRNEIEDKLNLILQFIYGSKLLWFYHPSVELMVFDWLT